MPEHADALQDTRLGKGDPCCGEPWEAVRAGRASPPQHGGFAGSPVSPRLQPAGSGLGRGLEPGRPFPPRYQKVALWDPPSPPASAQPPPAAAASTTAALIMTNYTSAAQLVLIHVASPSSVRWLQSKSLTLN